MLRSSEPSLPYRQAVCLNEEQYPLFCAWRARIASEEGKKLREIARGFFPCGLAIEKYIVDKISDGDKIVCVASEYFGDFCACMDAIGHPILGGGTPVVLLLVEKQLAGRYDTSKSSVLISSQRHAELALWLDREQKLTGQSRDSLVCEAFVPEWEMDIATVDFDSYECSIARASDFERGYKTVSFGVGMYERFMAHCEAYNTPALKSGEPSFPYRQMICLTKEQYSLFCTWRARVASEEGKKPREIACDESPIFFVGEDHDDKIRAGGRIVCVASEYFNDCCRHMGAIGYPILGEGLPVVLVFAAKQLVDSYSGEFMVLDPPWGAASSLWLDREQKLTGQSRDSLVFEAFVPEWEMDIATVDLDSYQCYTIRASAFERGYKLVRFGSGVYERFEAYVNDNPVISGVGTPISVLAEAVAGMAMRPIWAVGSWLAGLGGFSAKSHSD